jgi:hypothetical protein
VPGDARPLAVPLHDLFQVARGKGSAALLADGHGRVEEQLFGNSSEMLGGRPVSCNGSFATPRRAADYLLPRGRGAACRATVTLTDSPDREGPRRWYDQPGGLPAGGNEPTGSRAVVNEPARSGRSFFRFILTALAAVVCRCRRPRPECS